MANFAVIGAGIAGCATAILLQVILFETRGINDKVNGAGLLLLQPASNPTYADVPIK